jgi:CHAT domain-containing protein/Tfp pilus assembly protein PilF
MGVSLYLMEIKVSLRRTILDFVFFSKISAIAAIITFIAISVLFGSSPVIDDSTGHNDFSTSFNSAKQERINGHFQKSVDLFKACLSLRKNDIRTQVECRYNLAILYWNVGDLKESKTNFSEAADLAQPLGLAEFKTSSLSAIRILNLYQAGKAHRVEGNYQQSIETFSEAIALSDKIQCPEMELKCIRLMSLTYWELNNFDKFYQLNLEALNIAELLNHDREKGRCLNNLGAYYSRQDNYGSALSSYEKALNIAIERNYTEDVAISLLNLGGTWSDLGNYERSLEYLKKALNLDRGLKDKSNIAKDLNNIGIATRLKGLNNDRREDLKDAEKAFRQSLEIAREVGDGSLETQVLNNIGSIYADLHQFYDALNCFKQAASIAEKDDDDSYLGMVYNNIGITYSNLNNYEESSRYYDLALELSSTYKGGTFVWETYLELANLDKKQEDYDGALRNYRNSVASIEHIRTRIKLEDLKASYLGTDKRLEAYQNLIGLLVTLHGTAPSKGYDKEAFNYLERAKARAFLDSLEVAQVDISTGINPVLANREKEIMRDISRSYNKLLVPGLSTEDRDTISSQIKTSEDRLESLKREIRMSSPAYADLKYPEVVTYDEVRKSLSTPDVAYFAYSVGKEASHAFVITSRGLKTFNLPARAILQQQVAGYRKAISDRTNRDFHLGRELFQELVSPGLEPGLKKIVIVPDDILNLLPFETLLTSKEPDSWLVRDYMVGYTPSLSSLRILMERHQNGPRPRKDLLAIGNPVYGSSSGAENGNTLSPAVLYNFDSSSNISLPALKYSGLEIENISHLFRQNKVTVLEKENATERWLKSNPLADYKIIHFAAHSVIDDKKPTRSAIVLSFRQNLAGNGLLQTRDIYNLKLNADLVTLSACQTGLGQFIRGEGIEGLSRAFFYAGSSSVLMSLWSVNDQATYLLMERFYRHLKSSESLMGALRNAKLEMIHSRTLSHPYYWAGFVISGRTDTQVFSRSRLLSVFLAGLLGVGIILLLSTAIRKQKRP